MSIVSTNTWVTKKTTAISVLQRKVPQNLQWGEGGGSGPRAVSLIGNHNADALTMLLSRRFCLPRTGRFLTMLLLSGDAVSLAQDRCQKAYEIARTWEPGRTAGLTGRR